MIKVTVEENALRDIEQKLGGLSNKAPSVLKKAVNETARSTKTKLYKKTKQVYAVTNKKKFNQKSFEIKSATVGSQAAFISTKGEMLELIDFKVSPKQVTRGSNNRPKVYKSKVLKENSMEKLQVGKLKAFIVQFSNDHQSVVQRVPGKKMERNPKRDFIKKLLSPSVPGMVGGEKVYGVIEPEIATDLKNNIDKHIKVLMGE